MRHERRIASSKLRAVSDGPILFRGVENVHEHVLRPDPGVLAEQFRDPPEQRSLLFQGAGVEHGDLRTTLQGIASRRSPAMILCGRLRPVLPDWPGRPGER